jgi:hypothetical protein
MTRWTAAARRTTRALPALVVAGCLVAAVAYAAPDRRSSGRAAEESRRPASPRPGRPLITRHPEKASTSTTASFSFKAARGAPRFQCRYDGSKWKRCRAPFVLGGLAPGEHSFSVRVVGRRGRPSAAARFRWRLFEPQSFAIEPRLASLGALYPGAPAQALPVVLRNPNPVTILVTSVRVAATIEAAGLAVSATTFTYTAPPNGSFTNTITAATSSGTNYTSATATASK